MFLGYFNFKDNDETTEKKETRQAEQIVDHMSDLQSFIDSEAADEWFKDDLVMMISDLIYDVPNNIKWKEDVEFGKKAADIYFTYMKFGRTL